MVKVRLQIIYIFLLFQMSNSLLISAKVRLIFLLCIPPQKIKYFWPRRDSNTQPSDLESDALPLRHGVYWLYTSVVQWRVESQGFIERKVVTEPPTQRHLYSGVECGDWWGVTAVSADYLFSYQKHSVPELTPRELARLNRIKDILSLPIWSACYQINGT